MTELVLIIDRSGAMSGLEGDAIGGFNAVIHRLCRPKTALWRWTSAWTAATPGPTS